MAGALTRTGVDPTDPTCSWMVQAPAGSGKTTLLVERFLRLLAHPSVTLPEACLAITFTKKAAEEMKHRILSALTLDNEWGSVVIQKSRQLEWDLELQPHRLRIMTLDAFCMQCVQSAPLATRLGGLPRLSEEPHRLYEKAVERLLASAADKESAAPLQADLSELLDHWDNEIAGFSELLKHLLEKREQWLDHLGEVRGSVGWTAVIEQHLDQIDSGLSSLGSLFKEDFFIFHPGDEAVYTAWPNPTVEQLSWYQGLAEWCLREDGAFRKQLKRGHPWSGTKKEQQQHRKRALNTLQAIESLIADRGFERTLQGIQYMPLAASERADHLLPALKNVLKHLVSELQLVFYDEVCIDFPELMIRTLEIIHPHLDSYSELAFRLERELKHILVDEFQDTSIGQYQLLCGLTQTWVPQDGRTVFLVGDPLQSIYKFRNANLSLFLSVQQNGLGDYPLRTVCLEYNYRALPALVETANDLFRDCFVKTPDLNLGAAAYQPMKAASEWMEGDALFPLGAHFVKQTSDAKRASHLVACLKQLEKAAPLESKALLVRNRRHVARWLPILRAAGVAYDGVELDHLLDKPAVADAFSLWRLCVHPGDKVAYHAVLFSPLIGLSWRQLESLEERVTNIRWIYFETLYRMLRPGDFYGPAGVSHFIAIWKALGGDALYHTETDQQYLNHLWSILESKSLRKHFWDLERLTAYLRAVRVGATAENPSALQIMTVHKSKGLEFDNVFFASLFQPMTPEPPALWLWSEYRRHGKRFLLNSLISRKGEPRAGWYRWMQHHLACSAEEEAWRLFYVAYTRAKKRFVAYGDEQPVKGSYQDKLAPHLIWTESLDALLLEWPDTFLDEDPLRERRGPKGLPDDFYRTRLEQLQRSECPMADDGKDH